jgi:hypothetical protein
MNKVRIALIAINTLVTTLIATGRAAIPDLTVGESFPATGIGCPQGVMKRVFPTKESRANFTALEGVKDIKADGGVLSFTLEKNSATLGWGNYKGLQPLAERAALWPEFNNVVLKVRASAPSADSVWTLRYWMDGAQLGARRSRKRGGIMPVEIKPALSSDNWTNVAFIPPFRFQAPPDGFDIEVKGAPGLCLEIESVSVEQPAHAGYCRKVFDLPEGQVWVI